MKHALAFPFKELLQYFAISGRTGEVQIESTGRTGKIFLANGLAVNAETAKRMGEGAFLEILSWSKPTYTWEDNRLSPSINMNQTVQDMLMRHSAIDETTRIPIVSPGAQKQDSVCTPIRAPLSIKMEIQSPEITPFSFFIKKSRIYIGRDLENDLSLSDSFLSIRHAVLLTAEDGVIVQDLGSRNGTFIDGKFTCRGIARIGQTISLGQVKLDLLPA